MKTRIVIPVAIDFDTAELLERIDELKVSVAIAAIWNAALGECLGCCGTGFALAGCGGALPHR
jgi:hypothetical protein